MATHRAGAVCYLPARRLDVPGYTHPRGYTLALDDWPTGGDTVEVFNVRPSGCMAAARRDDELPTSAAECQRLARALDDVTPTLRPRDAAAVQRLARKLRRKATEHRKRTGR